MANLRLDKKCAKMSLRCLNNVVKMFQKSSEKSVMERSSVFWPWISTDLGNSAKDNILIWISDILVVGFSSCLVHFLAIVASAISQIIGIILIKVIYQMVESTKGSG